MPADRSEYARMLAASQANAEDFALGDLTARPLRGVAILTCMDTRMVIEQIFGLRAGDGNVLRNAGAVASDDILRSLLLSRHVLGTSEVVVLGHTGCGMLRLDDQALSDRLALESGHSSDTRFGSFTGIDEHVLRQVARIRQHPWMGKVPVHGLVYEVETGRVREAVRP